MKLGRGLSFSLNKFSRISFPRFMNYSFYIKLDNMNRGKYVSPLFCLFIEIDGFMFHQMIQQLFMKKF